MNNNLDRIEAHLRTIFEESLVKIFTGKKANISLIDELVIAMQKNILKGQDGRFHAPGRFLIHVPPEDYLDWQKHQEILDQMANAIYEAGQAEGFLFQKPPTIELRADPDVQNKKFSISAQFNPVSTPLPDTAAMTPSAQNDGPTLIPEDALLVIGGRTSFPLEKSVIDIGRHSSNDLILDDLHVSRHHAQLRAIKRQYVIFDVGSTSGIFLNGRRILQATLQPGDVVRLGAVNLIYIQDATSSHQTTSIPSDSTDKFSGESFG